MNKVYKNSTELMQLHGQPIYMQDMVDACLVGRLNLFLQGDTGSGKTQLARDVMAYFGTTTGDGKFASQLQSVYKERLGNPANTAINATKSFPQDRSLFILGRNDMDTRELFQQINLGKLYTKPTHSLEPLVNPDTGEVEFYYPKVDEKGIFVYQRLTKDQAEVVRGRLEQLAGSTENLKEITSRVNTNLIVVDELPNCVAAVRAHLFNIGDGFIELNGKAYPFGNGYSVMIATGNLGQKFTESSNELGRALKDRMHVIIDTDYFFPGAGDTLEILAGNTNPRVEFTENGETDYNKIIDKHREVTARPIPLEKLFIANYLLHGLDYCSKGSKRKMKDAWPTQLENHEQGSDVGLVLPVSPRAAKSIIRLSQSLDQVAVDKGVPNETVESGAFDSMMQAYKFVSAYSGVLNDASVEANYGGDRYKAIDAVIATTRQQFYGEKNNPGMNEKINAGLEMVSSGKLDQRVLNLFQGRWEFMRPTLEQMLKSNTEQEA